MVAREELLERDEVAELLPIFCPLMVIMLLCIQYFTIWSPWLATACAISHS